jgi:hypothetical protein
MMKIPKNMLVLIGSYLGMLVLVCCVAQFLSPLSVSAPKETGGKDHTTSAGNRHPTELPPTETVNGSLSDTEDAESAAVTLPIRDEIENGKDDVPANGEAELPIYYLKSVHEEMSSAIPVIGVYDENGQLLETLDTPIYALPVGDKAKLEVGIAVTGREALEDLIEDFGG